MTTKTNYLESVQVFYGLNNQEIEAIGHTTRLVTYPAEHLFYMPYDPAEVMFILKKGRVQLYRLSPEGRKLVVMILQPGAVFGHMALIGQRLHNTYAQALDEVTICIWNRTDVERLLIQRPQVALRFLELMGERLARAEDRLLEYTFKRVPARLAGLLLQLSRETHHSLILTGYTHQALAEMLGIYRETVSDTLRQFKNQGVLRVGRKQIELLDLGALETIAEMPE
jgi:CRP-like cAMP-binding protein